MAIYLCFSDNYYTLNVMLKSYIKKHTNLRAIYIIKE